MAVIGGDPLADFTILVTSNIDGAIAGLATLSSSLEGMQGLFSGMTALGGLLTVGVTLPIMAVAAAAVLSENTMQGFYQTLQAGSVSSSISFDKLKDSFNQLYTQFPQGGAVIANTLLNVSNVMGSTFGGNQQDIQNFTAQILAASQITGQSADSMSKSVSQAFTQFKVSASDAIPEFNYLYSAAQLAREPVATLADELGQYGPTLSAFKLPMNDIIALLGNLNQSGLDVSKTVTGIGYAFATLEAGGKTVAPVIDAISKEEGGLSIQSMSATQILEGLFTGIQDGSITAAEASDIFGKRYAANIYSAISSGHLSFQQFEADAGSFNGSLTDMADNSATLSQKLDELKHDFEEALAPLGLTIVNTLEGFMPVIVSILNYVKDLLTLFNELPQPIQDVVIIFAAVLAALGPILLIVGSLGSAFLVIGPAIGLMIPLLGGVLVQLGLMDVAMGILDALSLPLLVTFGAIAVAVIGLALLGDYLYHNWAPFKTLVDEIAGAFETILVTTGLIKAPAGYKPVEVPTPAKGQPGSGEATAGATPLNPRSAGEKDTYKPTKLESQNMGVGGGIGDLLGVAGAPSWGDATKGGILDPAAWASGGNSIKVALQNFGGWIMGGLGTIVSGLKTFGGDVVSFFQPLTNALTTAGGAIAKGAAYIGGIFFGMQEVICGVMIMLGSFVGTAWQAIVNVVGPPLNTMKNDITGGLNTIKVFFVNLWNGIVSFFQGVWNTLVNILGPPLNTMKNDVLGGLNTIKTDITDGLNTIKVFFEGIWNGIVSFFTGIWNSLTSGASTGATNVKTNAESPINTLVSDLKGLWNTIVTDCQNAWNTLCNWISQIKIPMPAMPDVKGWLEGIPGGGLIIKGLEDMHIPGFGEGGIVTEPTFAMLAEKGPELVIPVSAIQGASQVSNMVPQLGSQAQTTGKGGDFNFDVNIERATLVTPQDAQVLGLQIAYTAQRELARAGYTPG
jgi:TP901 family phage tail tape measure protein